MVEYIFLIFFLFVLALFGRNNKCILLVALAMLMLLGGFRDVSVGTDSANYEKLYYLYEEDVFSMSHAYEPLFMLIQYISAICSWGYYGLQIICMAIILSFLYVFIVRESYHYLFSVLCYVLLYFFFYSLNTTRQYLAIPVVLLSYYYLNRGENKKYIFCLLIATMFHLSAILTVIILLWKKLKLSKELQIHILVFSFIIGLTPIVHITINSAISYTLYDVYSTETSDGVRESLFSISRLLLNIYVIWLIKQIKNNSLYLSILVFGVVLLNIFAYQAVMGRMAQYFTVVQIVIIPNLPYLIKNRGVTIPVMCVSVAYMFVTWLYLINSNVGEVVPWKFGNFSNLI